MNFEIISKISNIETIAISNSIKDIDRIKREYGTGRGN